MALIRKKRAKKLDILEDGKSLRSDQNAHSRALSEPALVPLSDDGEATKAKLAEIQAFMLAAGEGGYADKIGEWRKELRACRYQDWNTARLQQKG